jgi:hypothetical protein
MIFTIFLHIGAGKTASSAIQKFLNLNAAEFESAGIFVPDNSMRGEENQRGQHVSYFEWILEDPGSAAARLQDDIQRITAEKPDCHSIVLSAENLSNPHGYPALFKELAELYEIRIIFYVRRQDDYFISAWQQWYCKRDSDFNRWTELEWIKANWQLVCMRWAKVVPLNRMRVRVYETISMANGGILADFADALQYPDPVALHQPALLENPSLCDAVTELATGKRSLFHDIHDNNLYEMILDLTGTKYVKRKRETCVSIEDRCKLIASYRECNEWLCQTFGLAENADLLFPDIRQQNFREITAEEIRAEKEEIILALISSLYSRMQAISQRA